jgi:hypothetical protein
MCTTIWEIINGNKKFLTFFSKFRRDNSVSYHQTMTKFELDQCILLPYPNVKFELNMYDCCGDNEWKLKASYYFQSERGITLPKIIEP